MAKYDKFLSSTNSILQKYLYNPQLKWIFLKLPIRWDHVLHVSLQKGFFFQSVMSLKINLVLLLKFAVSTSHENISLILVKSFKQDNVKLSSFPVEEDPFCVTTSRIAAKRWVKQTSCFNGQNILNPSINVQARACRFECWG